MKEWLAGMKEEEEQGTEGKGDRWRAFAKLIQTIWDEGCIPQQMCWMIVIFIPKGGGNYCGIGLLEPFWKVIEILLDRRLKVIDFHNSLHGFLQGRGCGTTTMEAKLVQQFAYLEQQALYGVFVDLKKAYDAMDRERCIELLKEYGVGPRMMPMIIFFWDDAMMVCRATGNYGEPFQGFRGVTQGRPLSPLIFNIMVDAIVREWLRQVLVDRAAKEGYGDEVNLFLAIFYADDVFIAARDPERLQQTLDILVGLFERVGLRTNTTKT